MNIRVTGASFSHFLQRVILYTTGALLLQNIQFAWVSCITSYTQYRLHEVLPNHIITHHSQAHIIFATTDKYHGFCIFQAFCFQVTRRFGFCKHLTWPC